MALKLTYFPLHGRGAGPRWAMVMGNIEFEDNRCLTIIPKSQFNFWSTKCRIPFPQWKELKPKTTFGTLPILEVGDTTITEVSAIMRLIGIFTFCCCYVMFEKVCVWWGGIDSFLQPGCSKSGLCHLPLQPALQSPHGPHWGWCWESS